MTQQATEFVVFFGAFIIAALVLIAQWAGSMKPPRKWED